jgi:hypothetical protein
MEFVENFHKYSITKKKVRIPHILFYRKKWQPLYNGNLIRSMDIMKDLIQ